MRNKRYKALEAQPNSLCFETMLLPFNSRCFTKALRLRRPGLSLKRWIQLPIIFQAEWKDYELWSMTGSSLSATCLPTLFGIASVDPSNWLNSQRIRLLSQESPEPAGKSTRSKFLLRFTGLLAAFTFQDQPCKPIANRGQSNLWGTSNVALDQWWPGSTLPARVPCLLLRVVLELLEMFQTTWWNQIMLASQLFLSQEPEVKRLKSRSWRQVCSIQGFKVSRHSFSCGHAVVAGNLAGTWNFKTTELKKVPAKFTRFQCLVGLFKKRDYMSEKIWIHNGS